MENVILPNKKEKKRLREDLCCIKPAWPFFKDYIIWLLRGEQSRSKRLSACSM